MAEHTSRLLALLSLLQTQRDWPGQVLADRLGVTTRTIRRDIDRLRELGYRVGAAKGPDGGYRLAAGAQLPPLLFDDEQAVAIALALRSVPALGVDATEAAARALMTFHQVMPSRLRHRIDAVEFTAATSTSDVSVDVIETVSRAVRDRRILRFDYRVADPRARRAEPYGVVAKNGRWYLVAWDLDHDDWRIFRLDRLSPRTPGGDAFTPRPLPAADVHEFLAARFKGSTSENAWPCVGEVVVALPLTQVMPWVGDGTAVEISDGCCRLVLGSWSWTGLLSQVLRFDAPFTVVSPAPLRAAAATLSDRLTAAAAAEPQGG